MRQGTISTTAFALATFFVLIAGAPIHGEAPHFTVGEPPRIDARAIVVMDYANGDILYALDPDETIPPASLTKLMTLHVALKAVESGRVSLSDIITIRREEASPHLPYGSSLMYLQEGMHVPFEDLLRGMAVISGNDAAFTVARVLGGSNEGFARLMNDEARALGLGASHFVEPSGLSEENLTTAREMAILARNYLRKHPGALAAYNSRLSMEFPRADVMPDGVPPPDIKILLRNRNGLLFTYEGCDGLKTGYIDESGFNLVATAERDGTRFIVITMGGTYGPASRERGGAMLLDWAFSTWKTVRPAIPSLPEVRVWGGARQRVALNTSEDVSFTVPAVYAGYVSVRLEVDPEASAPVAKGDRMGRLVFTAGDRILRRIDLVASDDAPLGNFLVRIKDAIVRFFSNLFNPKS
ncbi:MAG: D-alanyl-D-alanine carboxypeptidase [Spirochaetales bacterium]|nr:MAG: D-alanyl-D-alanine carboxypeptidase [Spirochaetales bacterium]